MLALTKKIQFAGVFFPLEGLGKELKMKACKMCMSLSSGSILKENKTIESRKPESVSLLPE